MSLDPISPAQATGALSTGGTGARAGSTPQAAGAPAPAVTIGVPAAAPPPAADPAAKAAELEAVRQAANSELQKNGRELAFEFDDVAGRIIARLIDTRTKEVLRQVPSREALAIAKALAEERSKGVLLQANA